MDSTRLADDSVGSGSALDGQDTVATGGMHRRLSLGRAASSGSAAGADSPAPTVDVLAEIARLRNGVLRG